MTEEKDKIKLIGLTDYAKEYLSEDDIEALTDLIGTEVTVSDEKATVDDSFLMMMADGETCHKDFLILSK